MTKDFIKKAIFALKKGELICYPTDTLYGIGADIYSIRSVKKVFEIKNRPSSMPLSVAVSNKKSLEKVAFANDISKKLFENFLPGPLCMILKKRKTIHNAVTSGLETVAIRVPKNKTCLKLLSDFGPITCTSANLHKSPTPNTISDIYMQFKDDISVYIDEGVLDSKPSTIVDVSDGKVKIIRQGAISREEIFDVI